MFYIFGGLPGTGKSTLSSALARHLGAFYLRIDTIEQALRDSGVAMSGPEGYLVGYGLALENLRLGASVVADSVNPIGITRQAWRGLAGQAGVAFVEIEVVCSDAQEHRQRIETRSSNVPGLRLPTWDEVVGRDYEAWGAGRLVIDTAGRSVTESFDQLLGELSARE